LVACLAAWLITAPGASAAGFDDIVPRDSDGIAITDYPLSFSTGGGIMGMFVHPNVTGAAAFAMIMYGLFLFSFWLGFTMLNILVLIDWLSPLVGTVDSVSASLYSQYGWKFIVTVIFGSMLLTVAGFGLRNKTQNAWRHVGTTLACMGVLSALVAPVAYAAKMLGIGRTVALETGSAITGQQPNHTNPTAPLIDHFVRRTVQRWTFGHDLDSLGCGKAWTQKVLEGDPDKVKDAAWACPGGYELHLHAMNPQGALVETFLYPAFGLFALFLIGYVVVKVFGVSVAALVHMGFIKVSAPAAGTTIGQWFIARNGIDGTTCGMHTGGYLLALFVGADITKVVAQVTPSSVYGVVVTILVLAGIIAGIKRASRNLGELSRRLATQFQSRTTGAAPPGAAAGGGSRGRALAVVAAGEYAAGRARRAGKKVVAAMRPEAAVATSLASSVRAAAGKAARRTNIATPSSRPATGPGGLPGGGGPAGAAGAAGGYGLPGLSGAGAARAAAIQYRTHRAALYMPTPPRVAGRHGSQPGVSRGAPSWPAAGTTAAKEQPGRRPRQPVSVAAGAQPDQPPAGVRRSPQVPPPAPTPRPSSGSTGSARDTARSYRHNRRKP
jgi:hypothetical protein